MKIEMKKAICLLAVAVMCVLFLSTPVMAESENSAVTNGHSKGWVYVGSFSSEGETYYVTANYNWHVNIGGASGAVVLHERVHYKVYDDTGTLVLNLPPGQIGVFHMVFPGCIWNPSDNDNAHVIY